MFNFFSKKSHMVDATQALPGRPDALPTAALHFVNGAPIKGPYPGDCEQAIFGMGCFWGAERKFWQAGEGVFVTAVGYTGGFTPNPTYEETCTGLTGHAETVRVVYHPRLISYADLLKIFWENHDPTQGMRQGGDVGTVYRSAIFANSDAQLAAARDSAAMFGERLQQQGFGPITTEIAKAGTFYFAETYHQQYLAKTPGGYCGLGGTGVSCPIGVARVSA